ncbi:heme peroxidase [Sistotremastrum suecicum HHB10207 ss-3]|uniref:Peroxidase n=1 Tax=Sistotremastrum suecicum HHB10207 ss-3 TaxID=1314776 RepID=A0A166ATS0_9AGAM|nr:heme peroxidase [Sistotremastrum suecicum HHB10207 ss-3]
MLLLVSCLFLHLYPAFAYLYPDRLYEELEHLLVDTNGYNSGHFAVGVTPCTLYFQGPQTTGRQTSAQWMRVAFHDFSTANVAAGTGGIDASIGFETTRPENSGIAMNDSLSYWAPFVNTYASMADMVALGSTVASAACGGPIFPFKGGRISATQAGEFGVPEPDEELQPTLERFAGAGFSQTRAIQLTACSVHHAGFPLIVDTSVVTPNNTQGGIHFDDTVAVFDNHVVTEYIDGTTPNPLVTSFNVSQRSDLRLFSSDNNATMQGLQDAATFASVCTDVFTQMLNTVPSGVSLRDITPIPLKPVNIQLGVSSAGTATLTGAIRVCLS